MKNDYTELAWAIYLLTGPAENILTVTHCMTRLRLCLADNADAAERNKRLKSLPGVLGVNDTGEELQIVLGPGRVERVAECFEDILAPVAEERKAAADAKAGADTSTSDENGADTSKSVNSVRAAAAEAKVGSGKALHEAIRAKNATPIKLLFKRIASIFIPLIPAFIACGLISGILNTTLKLDPSLSTNPYIQLLAVAGNVIFWSMNLFVGWNAAKEFGGTPILGGILGALISHPGLAQIAIDGENLVPGRGGVISVLLVAALAAVVEKKVRHIVPEMFSLFLTPLITFLITGSAALFILQPVGGFLSDLIGNTATMAIGAGGAVTGFILGGTFLPMVMLGIHQTLTPIHAELLSRYGVTILLPVLAMAGAGQVGASIAVYLKTKNRFLKKTVASALPVGILGVGEPLIYGVTLPLGKPFIGACIGGAFGGAVQAAFQVGAATLGISGLPLAAAADQPLIYLTGLVTAYIGGFIATWLIGFDDPPEEN